MLNTGAFLYLNEGSMVKPRKITSFCLVYLPINFHLTLSMGCSRCRLHSDITLVPTIAL